MQINMHEAKSQLSKLVQAALDGEEVIIARNGAPVVQLIKYTPVKAKRNPGAWAGKIWIADDWDSPETNQRISAMLESSPLFPAEPDKHTVNEPKSAYKATPKKRPLRRTVKPRATRLP